MEGMMKFPGSKKEIPEKNSGIYDKTINAQRTNYAYGFYDT